ncbi:MAG: type II toxin-antitoxin system PemK/MazF family toxin [Ruminococcus sp.]|nr:type II toxin-antitoxin system PemK/MazF family toxin [Ruminococcus sp.]
MTKKHKRDDVANLTPKELADTLLTVEKMINGLPAKQQHIMSEWLSIWSKYISFEKTFQPSKLKYYKRGEIVLAHFGFNTGSELGGPHYAVVVEKNNNNKNNTVVVVPLSSLGGSKTKERLHHSEVYLGKVLPDSDKESYAMPAQIRAISKLRIVKPKTADDSVYKISNEQLQVIDEKIKLLFTK